MRLNIPPVPSVLCLSAFELCDGTKGGTFSYASIFCAQCVVYSLWPHRRLALSPKPSDLQSEACGLAVRPDGLNNAIRYSKRDMASLLQRNAVSR